MDHYQYNGQQTPPVNRNSYGNQIWYIWGPIVVKIVIGMIVSGVASAAIGAAYMIRHYGLSAQMTDYAQQIANIYQKDYVQILKAVTKEAARLSSYVEGVAAFVTIPVLLIMFHKDRIREKLTGFTPNKKAPLWKYSAVALLSVALCVGVNNLLIIGNITTVSEEYQTVMQGLYSAPLLIQGVSLGILVPICEELVFRGLVFQRLRMRSGFLSAALYSAVIFSLLHGNMVQMIYALFLGVVYAYMYEKYGSVKAPIFAHMVANLISVFATHYNWFEWMAKDPMRIGIITVLCGTIGSSMYVWMQRIEEKPDHPNKPEQTLHQENLTSQE